MVSTIFNSLRNSLYVFKKARKDFFRRGDIRLDLYRGKIIITDSGQCLKNNEIFNTVKQQALEYSKAVQAVGVERQRMLNGFTPHVHIIGALEQLFSKSDIDEE